MLYNFSCACCVIAQRGLKSQGKFDYCSKIKSIQGDVSAEKRADVIYNYAQLLSISKAITLPTLHLFVIKLQNSSACVTHELFGVVDGVGRFSSFIVLLFILEVSRFKTSSIVRLIGCEELLLLCILLLLLL